MSRTEEFEYTVLGCRVKFNPAVEGGVRPEDVVELIRSEATKIKQASPQRSESECAVLIALKLASEKMALEKEYRQNINKLENSVSDALEFVEQVSPTTA